MRIVTGPEVLSQFHLEYFKSASTFGALSDDTLIWMLNEGTIYELETDDVLFEPGDRGDAFYVILQGTFAYYKSHEDHLSFIRDYQLGEQIGFMSMIALHNRVGRAIAKEKCLVLEVNYETFHRLHETATLDFGLLMMNLAREMARRMRTLGNIVVDKDHTQPAPSDKK